MVDFLGNEINIGDTVAIQGPYRNKLIKGVVFKLTPLGATINCGPISYYKEDYKVARLSSEIVKLNN